MCGIFALLNYDSYQSINNDINLKKELHTLIFKTIPSKQKIDQDILNQIENILNMDPDFQLIYDNLNNNI